MHVLCCVPFISLGHLCLTGSSPNLCSSVSGSSFGRDPLETMLRHLSCGFVPSVTLFTLAACAGTNCTGLGTFCFPFLLSWIIPACINSTSLIHPLTQEVCVPISPLNPCLRDICPLYSVIHPEPTILFPCARHSTHPLSPSSITLPDIRDTSFPIFPFPHAG